MDTRFRKAYRARHKYSRLRCLLRVQGLVIFFYLVWSGSFLQFRQNIIKVGSKSWLLTCSSNITLRLPSYTGSALKRELNFCNGYLRLLYFWDESYPNDKNFVNSINFKIYTTSEIPNLNFKLSRADHL